jgi:ArsR family transcriptional regulator
MFKALSDETRIKIVEMLSCGEMCACDILESFKITQPTISYHMKILSECGLVKARKDGPWMKYVVDSQSARKLKDFLEGITTESENCICKNIEKYSDCK